MCLVEIIIATAIVLSICVTLITISLTYYQTAQSNIQSVKATYLIEEGLEVVNFLKTANWDGNIGSLTVGTDYYLAWSTTTRVWATSTTPNTIDNYNRKFKVEDVNRDGNDDIASSGFNDPKTKKVTVTVAWPSSSGTTTKSISAYIMK